jgi:hypothetical protein
MGTISRTRLCLPGAQKERRNLACGTGAGDDRGHLWPGPRRLRSILARDTGVSRPLRDRAGVYRCRILRRLLPGDRRRPRVHLQNRATLYGGRRRCGGGRRHGGGGCAPAAWVLAVGIPVAGSSSGLASPPLLDLSDSSKIPLSSAGHLAGGRSMRTCAGPASSTACEVTTILHKSATRDPRCADHS